jgi:hypothetical protein
LHLYKLVIDQTQYDIDERKSDSILTLSANSNPGADLSVGRSYTLFKSKYVLPIGFRRMTKRGEPVVLSRGCKLTYVPAESLLAMQAGNQHPAQETNYTIWPAGEFLGTSILEVSPPPSRTDTYDFVYESGGRTPTLRSDRYLTGTVATDGTSTVIGTGTAWTASMVGCVIRFAAAGATHSPSGLSYGLNDDALPYEVQRVITSVASTTSLSVDANVSSLTDVKYSISDPVDLDPLIMQESFLREAESTFARLTGREDRGERSVAAKLALTEARIADNRQRELSFDGAGDRADWSLGDWAINESYGGSVIT